MMQMHYLLIKYESSGVWQHTNTLVQSSCSTWSGVNQWNEFEFGGNQNDWMKLVRKLNLIFMILQVWSPAFTLKPFLSYKRKCIIGGASFENIFESEIDPNVIRIRKFNLIFCKSSIQSFSVWLHSTNASLFRSDHGLIKDKWKEQKEILKNTINHVSILGRGNFLEKVFRCIGGCSLVEMFAVYRNAFSR
jgi:hypothetical protein